jgi:nucleoside-diphosphate-sugar epimerase
VGSHVAENALRLEGLDIRCLVRRSSDTAFLESLGVELIYGDLHSAEALNLAVADVDYVVHCAAKVGDWGHYSEFNHINVEGTKALLEVCCKNANLKKFVGISSLGVYEAKDHFDTDESSPIHTKGMDGYTRSKAEAENLYQSFHKKYSLPIVVLRPGFIYGERDRTVLPQLVSKLKNKKVILFGDGSKKMNNTYVKNLVSAIFLALESDISDGRTYNIHDGCLVSKEEFINTVAKLSGCSEVTAKIPLWFAKNLAKGVEASARLTGKKSSPFISMAKYKFMGLNLDFSIEKARQELGYSPKTEFRDSMKNSLRYS